jgi:hypothetical protein
MTASGLFPQILWKSLLKTVLAWTQTSEIRGLLALCTYFVQTCYAPEVYLFVHLPAKATKSAGFSMYLAATLMIC